MILIIDNYDSFTYNLVQYLGEVTEGRTPIEVVRNDEIDVAQARRMAPDHIVISPGPCTPKEAGISMAVARELGPSVPILGVCLGHQSIGEAYGAEVVRATLAVHGKTSRVRHHNQGPFAGLPNPFEATRYHSLVVRQDSLPACLEPLAWSVAEPGRPEELMGLRHRAFPWIVGVQFHPESILTNVGKDLLRHFLALRPLVQEDLHVC
ncbi:MAG: aminodeoxychorismate/anthranilate synthase component II [Bdellovibrionales bacterium]|nr:aminodeoxychorismate/anthranilate synthase component II [Bdellovibrionales bacterium]